MKIAIEGTGYLSLFYGIPLSQHMRLEMISGNSLIYERNYISYYIKSYCYHLTSYFQFLQNKAWFNLCKK